jgi:hypothetical protein
VHTLFSEGFLHAKITKKLTYHLGQPEQCKIAYAHLPFPKMRRGLALLNGNIKTGIDIIFYTTRYCVNNFIIKLEKWMVGTFIFPLTK